jgi:hypothetical protein
MTIPLLPTPSASNSDNFSAPGEARLEFDGALRFTEFGKVTLLTGMGKWFPPDRPFQPQLDLTSDDILSQVKACLAVWQDKVLDAEARALFGRILYPFKGELGDTTKRQQLLPGILPALAVAGAKLYNTIFKPSDGRSAELDALREFLEAGLRPGGGRLRIFADRIFVPWGLLYTHPGPEPLLLDGSNATWDGFWGMRHVIDHEIDLNPRGLAISCNSGPKVPTGVLCDPAILNNQGQARRWHEELLKLAKLDVRPMEHKDDLLEALAREKDLDQILYFYCHGVEHDDSEEPGLLLGDGQLFTSSDVDWCRQTGPLPDAPLVFINACRGAAGRTRFYDTVARRLLEKRAAGVIGSFADLPIEFASRYALLFFEAFLDRTRENAFPGILMQELTRRFLDEYKHPLGLTYVSYRAAGCWVDWPA